MASGDSRFSDGVVLGELQVTFLPQSMFVQCLSFHSCLAGAGQGCLGAPGHLFLNICFFSVSNDVLERNLTYHSHAYQRKM